MLCADCGVMIEETTRDGLWGAPEVPPSIGDKAWKMTCRQTVDTDGRLVAADYHHIEGEPQRHFVRDDTPGVEPWLGPFGRGFVYLLVRSTRQ